jgi:hypothetical protein
MKTKERKNEMPEGFFDASTLADGGRIYRNAVPDGNNTITRIWVPNTITEIDTWVFRNYTALEEVLFEDGPLPLSIGMMVFEGCTALTHVSLPGRVSNIGKACFRGCVNLAELEIVPGTAAMQMPSRVFDDCQRKDALTATLKAECDRRAALHPVVPAPQVRRPAAGRRPPQEVTPEEVDQYLLYPAMNEDVGQHLPEGIPNGTLFVCVDRTWGAQKCDERTGQRISLEDCARGYWCDVHLNKVRLAECQWLMAVAQDQIAGVWKIDLKKGWQPPELILKQTWPSDVGPWKVLRSGCLFMPDDDDVRATRAALMGKSLKIYFRQSQTVRGVFLRQ